MTAQRRHVFISHANPEDNAFARWLASRLEAIGYQVWLDLTHFRGGEPVWATIEHAIRDQAAIVLAVMSRSSYQKRGVLTEIAVAAATQRQLESAFLVPLRLDNLHFGDFPAQILCLNTLDFASGWTRGFRDLLNVLEKNRVPRAESSDALAIRAGALQEAADSLVDRPQQVCSNWFPITSLPDTIEFSRFSGPQASIPKISDLIAAPTAVHDRLIASFVQTSILQNCLATPKWLEPAGTMPLSAVLRHGPASHDFGDHPNWPLPPHRVRRIVYQLLRKALASTLSASGLMEYITEHDRTWYVPLLWKRNDRVTFVDVNGKRRWRQLCGRAREYHWHFGISCKIHLNNPMHLLIRPRVIFTIDGIRLARGKSIMNRLRKRHCKNWWNADWRDRIQAIAVALAGNNDHITIPLGGATKALINARPMVYQLGVRLADDLDKSCEEKATPSHNLEYIDEPLLRFGYAQNATHPRDGLFLFGPLKSKENPATMRIGIIGTRPGLADYRRWASDIRVGIPSPEPNRLHHRSWPGFETVFGTRWPAEPLVSLEVDADRLSAIIRYDNRQKALYEAVELFVKPIEEHIRQSEAPPILWFVIVPEDVYRYGRASATIPATERVRAGGLPASVALRDLRDGTPSLFPNERRELATIYRFEPNFHHQLKARLLKHRAVLQLVRGSTLTLGNSHGPRNREDPATVAWNLCTTSFFKASGRPWTIARNRPGVCYVGLVYKLQDREGRRSNACCGAQMFLDSGEGLVFRGAVGPWYSTTTKEYHLDTENAAELMNLVVKAYRKLRGGSPTELFIHSKTRFNRDEWKGFSSTVPSSTKLVGIRLRPRTSDIKLFSGGTQAILRGTAYVVNRHLGYLWTTGYTPQLGTYPGWETPSPMLVEVSRGDADLLTVMEDVMALTKLNFNSSGYADGQPVTLKFADAIGEILTAGPVEDFPPLPFRHYI